MQRAIIKHKNAVDFDVEDVLLSLAFNSEIEVAQKQQCNLKYFVYL